MVPFIPVGEFFINPLAIRSARVPADPSAPVDVVAEFPMSYETPGGATQLVVVDSWRFEGPDAATLRDVFAPRSGPHAGPG